MDMKKAYSVSRTKNHRNEPYFAALYTRRQEECSQANHVTPEQTSQPNHSLKLAASTSQNAPPPMLLPIFVALLLLFTPISPVLSLHIVSDSSRLVSGEANQTFKAAAELLKLRRIRDHLKKINKPSVKTIEVFSSVFYANESDSAKNVFT